MFESIKTKIADQKIKMKLSKSNKAEDVEFLMDILEFTHRKYSGLLFVPATDGYISKLQSIGFASFKPLHPGDIISSDFNCFYNEKKNIVIHVVPEYKWNVLNLTLDTTAQIYDAQAIPEAKAIGLIFSAISTTLKG